MINCPIKYKYTYGIIGWPGDRLISLNKEFVGSLDSNELGYYWITNKHPDGDGITYQSEKECALACVKNILKELKYNDPPKTTKGS